MLLHWHGGLRVPCGGHRVCLLLLPSLPLLQSELHGLVHVEALGVASHCISLRCHSLMETRWMVAHACCAGVIVCNVAAMCPAIIVIISRLDELVINGLSGGE